MLNNFQSIVKFDNYSTWQHVYQKIPPRYLCDVGKSVQIQQEIHLGLEDSDGK